MFIEERHQAILGIIEQQGRISVGEIQTQFGVSVDSARRDLRLLEEQGLLKRTHGGALPLRSIGSGGACHDMSSAERAAQIKENYLAIAKEAAAMIAPKNVVFLTSASIGFLIAENLPVGLACTIVTNSISIAETLRHRETITVIATGGEMHANGCFYDAFALETVSRLRFDKCFITSACISSDFGLSIQKSRNVAITNAVIDSSRSVIGVYPTEKIGFDSIVSICPANRLHRLITDWDAPEEELKKFDELGIAVTVTEKSIV